MKILDVRFLLLPLCVSLLVDTQSALGQQDSVEENFRFEFLPPGLHFAPLKANHQEARLGVFKYFGAQNLKVDIGNSIDLASLDVFSSRSRFTVGVEFMAFAYTTGAQGLRLQVDAIDGFFGGNLTASHNSGRSRLMGRLRILHLSAHMVDGHYLLPQRQWVGNREPIPFTKDFGELTIVREISSEQLSVRYYGGTSYATLVRPAVLKRFAFLAGLELVTDKLLGRVFTRSANVFLANHFVISGNPVYTGNNQLQIGVKFGEWQTKGIVIYLAYYTGNSWFSEYFDQRVRIVGGGFTVDFP